MSELAITDHPVTETGTGAPRLDLTLPSAPVREILERAFAEDAPAGTSPPSC
jgi:nicotinate-nucleotide pyrophosphorylase (carboxylating)